MKFMSEMRKVYDVMAMDIAAGVVIFALFFGAIGGILAALALFTK